ncbi:heme biosynthesis protein HemY, partial [Methylobacterium sp. WL18]
ALQAVKLAPDLVPAACIAGRLLSRRGDLRKAAKVVETAWKTNPHPDLAKVYLGLRPGDSVRDRLARAETLAKLSSWDPESRLAVAQASLDAREYGRAREALKPLLADRPTVRSSLMMAAIEEAEHGAASGQAREWLSRAARAPRDPVWIADGIASDTWAPVSPVSGRLDAFAWREPPNTLAPSAPAVEPEEPEMPKPVLVPAEPTPSAPLPTIIPAASPPAGPGADAVSAGMASAAVPASGERAARRTA